MSLTTQRGYQETAIGWIPTEWSVSSFGSLLATKPEYGANESAESCGGPEFVRYIRITDISESGTLIDSGKKYLSPEAAKNYLLTENDILIARSGNTVGKSLVYRNRMGKCAYAGYLIRFRVGANLNHDFMAQYLHSDFYWAWVKSSVKVGAQPNINSQQYQSLLIPVPPINEQKKIATILTALDDKLDVIRRQIATTETLKQGLMQTLFSRGVGKQDGSGRWVPHSEFKDSELGKIPLSWTCNSLGSLLSEKPEYGANASAIAFENDDQIRYLRITDIDSNGKIRSDSIKAIAEEEAKNYILRDGDLLIARSGNTVGKSILYRSKMGPCAFAGYLLRFRMNGNAIVEYVTHYITTDIYWSWIKSSVKIGAQPNINAQQYQSLLIPVPPVEEQKRIAKIVEAVEIKLDLLRDKKTHYQTLKRGLMQKLLTGEWRVKVEEPNSEDI